MAKAKDTIKAIQQATQGRRVKNPPNLEKEAKKAETDGKELEGDGEGK